MIDSKSKDSGLEKKSKGHCEENRFILLYNLYFYIQSLEFVLVFRRMLLNREPLFSESIMSSDEEGLDPQERLEKAQRKEKKDLQAKVQALKNSIPKGDKKKKKEVTAEIARLESDLDQKHSAEMLDLLTDNMSLNEDQEEPTNDTNCDNDVKMPDDKENEPRVSKAQKRREKKAEREKQRLEDIERQEAENLCGQRHLEQEAITRLLEARGLTLHQIPSDGDCMFAGEN